MVKRPVTVCYPQEKLAAPERLRGHIVNDMDVCICCQKEFRLKLPITIKWF